jgi:hypothetical protein
LADNPLPAEQLGDDLVLRARGVRERLADLADRLATRAATAQAPTVGPPDDPATDPAFAPEPEV